MVRLLDCSKESVQMYSTERKLVRLPTYTLFEEKRFIYNGEQLIAELDGDNNIQKEFIWGNDVNNQSSLGQTSTGGVGALVGLKVHNSNNTISSYAYISDNVGNIVALVDKKGKIVNKYSYSPFGKQNIIKEDIEQSFGFNTKLHDDTGLIYYNNRYYNADLGRFITRDPIREGGGSNLYNFVGNDPVNNWDVLGEEVFAAARDLAFPAILGNHHFITITNITQQHLNALGIPKKIENFGNGVMGITVGFFKGENGKLEVRYNEEDDLAATKEHYMNSQGFFFDWDYEQHQINPMMGESQAELNLRTLATIEALKSAIGTNTEYDLTNCNCATAVNNILYLLGIPEDQREDLTEFWGIDWGEEDLFSQNILMEASSLIVPNYLKLLLSL